MRELTFGYSPCPNDTFAFHALAHGLVDAPFRVRPVLLDIEELNRRAHTGAFDLTKMSVGAMRAVGSRYRLLRSGAALGHGVGPLVVARTPMAFDTAVAGRVAVPGRETTAYQLLRLAAPAIGQVVEMRYDHILRATAEGEVDAGLIIHESRFTYADHGLVKVIDLGAWWEQDTGLPVPLAGICARDDMDEATRTAAEAAIRASVQHAFDHPDESRTYVQAHAQEMSPEVCAQHIALYVNAHSLDIGDEGLRAVTRLMAAGRAHDDNAADRPAGRDASVTDSAKVNR
jgi:1,4-dihydroxy-6-naphthoate synthase